ncbi:MAG: hypothetical protein BroJett011_39520 [Chloroflexota bacterium]|jgi:hypothetical protein|nr:MAG: hypothetical protein BroJett011_39520 [Chloroflexota bacterium]
MTTAEIVYLMVTLLVGLANLFCLIYVLVKLYAAKGLLHVLLGFFCCTLYPFIWGWLNARRLSIYDVMIFWTLIVVLGLVLQIIFRVVVGVDLDSRF